MGLFSLIASLFGGGRKDAVSERRVRQPEQTHQQSERDDRQAEQSGHGADQQGSGPRRMKR